MFTVIETPTLARLANGEIWLLLVYGKSMRENIPAHVLRQIKEEIENA